MNAPVVTHEYELGHVWNFDYTGDVQTFTVPESGTYKVELWGAQGGNATIRDPNVTFVGGLGGYVSGKTSFEKNKSIYIYVGAVGQSVTSTVGTNISYNGGGSTYNFGGAGGGATDIRYFSTTPTSSDLNWDSTNGLNSRIMVAGGGGGANNRGEGYGDGHGGIGGGLIGGIPESLNHTNGYGYVLPTGGTQTSGGTTTGVGNLSSYSKSGGFGYGATHDATLSAQSGGGSGYYGGAAANMNGGAGGSSFISGYVGSLAIKEGSTSEPRALKDGCTSSSRSVECATHYSGLKFTDGVMIDGKGCNWSTGSATNCGVNQPQPDGTNATGRSGTGYARITLISYE